MSGAKVLSSVREKLQAQGFAALWVPSSDPHMSEYVADRYARRAFVSNFHGSAGTAVIPTAGDAEAKMWTDGRYWLEADATLYPGWGLMKDGQPDTQTIVDYLKKVSGTVAADPFTFTIEAWDSAAKQGVKLGPMQPGQNVVDLVWGGEASELSEAPVFDLPVKFSGQSVGEKIKAVRDQIAKEECDMLILSALDDIAWVLNLRGADVECNPVFYSYVLITADSVNIFIDPKKVPTSVKAELEALVAAKFYPYTIDQGLKEYLAAATKATEEKRKLVCGVDNKQTSQGIKLVLEGFGIRTKSFTPCVKRLKALKNDTELKGFRDCHIRDGVALTRFLAWVEKEIQGGNTNLDEVDAANKLEAFRREDDRFVQLSFPTISGSGPNGAVIHYRPEKGKCRNLSKDEMYLVDSGAQYWDGTTDVTRTVVFSEPSEFQRDAYTAVLKGHIAIQTAIVPNGVTGHRIDSFARNALWSMGLDYAHGTGHGVGHFLNVHEGPHGIGTRPPVDPKAVLEERMIVSNEPGYYQSGQFGIRIENLETIVAKETKYGLQCGGSEKKKSLGFEYLTMAPLCPALIVAEALSPDEKAWVNQYHDLVRQNLMPLIAAKEDESALDYLRRTTMPIWETSA